MRTGISSVGTDRNLLKSDKCKRCFNSKEAAFIFSFFGNGYIFFYKLKKKINNYISLPLLIEISE